MTEMGKGVSKIPDLSAPIVPGRSAAGIMIGSKIEDLLQQTYPRHEERRSNYLVQEFESARVWSLDGLVTQVGVYEGYRGKLGDRIGIGSSVAEVEDWCRCQVVEDDDDKLITVGIPGWSFETKEWVGNHSVNQNKNNPIIAIFVHRSNT